MNLMGKWTVSVQGSGSLWSSYSLSFPFIIHTVRQLGFARVCFCCWWWLFWCVLVCVASTFSFKWTNFWPVYLWTQCWPHPPLHTLSLYVTGSVCHRCMILTIYVTTDYWDISESDHFWLSPSLFFLTSEHAVPIQFTVSIPSIRYL